MNSNLDILLFFMKKFYSSDAILARYLFLSAPHTHKQFVENDTKVFGIILCQVNCLRWIVGPAAFNSPKTNNDANSSPADTIHHRN